MGCFQVRYDSRVIIYERKLFIRLATDCRYVASHTMTNFDQSEYFEPEKVDTYLMLKFVYDISSGREWAINK